MRRKKKKASTAKPAVRRPRAKKELVKPAGTRAEDVPDFALFRYIDGDFDELHFKVPHEYRYGIEIYTIKLKKNGEDCFEYSSIPTENDWDYKIEILKDKVVRIEVVGGKCVAKVFTKRTKND